MLGPIETKQHRHDWLTVVLWLAFDKCPNEANNFYLRDISYSTTPGNFDLTQTHILFADDQNGTKTHPILAYDSGESIIPSSSGPDADTLRPPLVGWGTLPDGTKEQLNGIQYENTKVPFSDKNFQSFLDAAYSDAFYKSEPMPSPGECGSDGPPQVGYAPPTSTAPAAKPTGALRR
ncbi:hypothetical protein LY78DRAFT_675421 [Colletotrichum sublineola]|uniref:Putative necrosis inducing protein n=1 Tax=Colletotrichum sublineola TaxID=1173701 RepID=A0A066XST7_COLSU|nr:hypothetical protein LY78DRAFT_675421 [Colletotrichum sublineola]KDN71932.1 putative necrosis inducing protein [Colletotrichum sublineola]